MAYADVICICTHNSRRSQLAEIWLKVISVHYDLPNLYSYSGGTEATSFNFRMLNALVTFGFDLLKYEDGDNPKYIGLADYLGYEQSMFSKKYNHEYNPQSDYTAVMVCDHADENCPVVIGAKNRFSLPYIDPKASDNTPKQNSTYKATVLEIGREMFYLGSKVASN